MGQNLARRSQARGLATPAKDFPEPLVEDLAIVLDKEDPVFQRDWRTFVEKLGLADNTQKQLKEDDSMRSHTKTALTMWAFECPETSNGKQLVKTLLDMRRRDAALLVESHLGQRYEPGSDTLDDGFQAVDTASRLGDLEELRELMGDRKA